MTDKPEIGLPQAPQSDEPQITLPLSVVRGLYDQVTDLSNQAAFLQAQLGALLSGQTVEQPADFIGEPAAPLVSESMGEPGDSTSNAIPKAVRLFSGAAAAAARQGDSLETLTARLETQNAFRQDIQTVAQPYIHAIVTAFQPKLADTEYKSCDLPSMPSYGENSEAWHKYVKRYGQSLKWSEALGEQTHEFECIYLPAAIPQLVGFRSESRVLVDSRYGTKDTWQTKFNLSIDRGSLTRIAYESLEIPQRRSLLQVIRLEDTIKGAKTTLVVDLGAPLTAGRTERRSGGYEGVDPYEKLKYDEERRVFYNPSQTDTTISLKECRELVQQVFGYLPRVPDQITEVE